MRVGSRIVVTDSCVWPERRGCHGVIVHPPAGRSYPQPGPGEVLVLLDDDPLIPKPLRRDGWSCVMDRKSVRPEA